jgi:hypothetical protein
MHDGSDDVLVFTFIHNRPEMPHDVVSNEAPIQSGPRCFRMETDANALERTIVASASECTKSSEIVLDTLASSPDGKSFA